MDRKRILEMEIKQKKEETSQMLVEKYKEENMEFEAKRQEEKRQKELEEKRLEQDKQKKMQAKLEEAKRKEEEHKRLIEEMRKARIKKVIKVQTPPKRVRKPKVDPNKVKFNVTEMIKNRTQ